MAKCYSDVEILDKIAYMTKGLCYGDIFREVRQRVTAYKYYTEEWYDSKNKSFDDILDDAYRFLYTSIEPEFIRYCAKKENMDPIEYTKMLVKDNESE